MTFAVIKLQGKQYQVSIGDQVIVDRLPQAEGDTITITDTLLYADQANVTVGTPVVAGKSATAKILRHLRGDKIRVATYKAKSRSRRVKGHRQAQTQIEILSIGGQVATTKSSSVASKSKPAQKPTPTKTKPAAKATPVRKPASKSKPSRKSTPKPKSSSKAK